MASLLHGSAAIPLEKHAGGHLVIIAGVGWQSNSKLVDDILPSTPKQAIRFLAVPCASTIRVGKASFQSRSNSAH
ncbi:hypothetical protein OK016_26210 [Vibrio chagasii]|nr:hypothetical protein [Vibrio chagasii]